MFSDDLSGKLLNTEGAIPARAEEMEEFKKQTVYDKVPVAESHVETDKAPLGIKWIDIDKGDEENVKFRSRLVAKETNRGKNEEFIVTTPPLEGPEMLLSLAVTEGIGHDKKERKHGMKIDVIDVRRAYFQARAKRDVYVNLPEDQWEEGVCRKLIKSMYGIRDAAYNWEEEYTGFMEQSEFEKDIGSRRGLGKIRHLEVNQLWLQQNVVCPGLLLYPNFCSLPTGWNSISEEQKVQQGIIELEKVIGEENASDLLTEHQDWAHIAKHVMQTDAEIRSDRHKCRRRKDQNTFNTAKKSNRLVMTTKSQKKMKKKLSSTTWRKS